MAHTPRGVAQRLVRILIAGGVLSVAWLAIDLISHAEPASAAERIDVDLPDAVGGVVDVVTAPITPVITNIVQPAVVVGVAPITAPTVGIVAPLQPVVVSVGGPVIGALVSIGEPIAPVFEPLVPVASAVLTPVATNVLIPLAPAVIAAVPPVAHLVVAIAPDLTPLGINGLLVGSSGALLALAVGAAIPLASAAPPGAPAKAPVLPNPSLPTSSGTHSALDGILASGIPALRSLRETVRAAHGDLPSSPTFAFDTTPD